MEITISDVVMFALSTENAMVSICTRSFRVVILIIRRSKTSIGIEALNEIDRARISSPKFRHRTYFVPLEALRVIRTGKTRSGTCGGLK